MTNMVALEAVYLGANFCLGLFCIGMGLMYFITFRRLTALESRLESILKKGSNGA